MIVNPGRMLGLMTVVLLMSVKSSAWAEEFDLYFLGGQSNMEGFGRNDELKPEEAAPVQNAYIFHSTPYPDQQPVDGQGRWDLVQPGHGTGFKFANEGNQLSDRFGCELSFAQALQQRKPQRKIAIIKYARNGSSIDSRAASNWGCWEPDFEANQGEHREVNQYDQLLATLNAAFAMKDIDGDGSQDVLVPAGILWMQGESDAANSEEVARSYEANLKRLMDLIRAALRRDDLPVVIGQISDAKKGQAALTWPYGEIVREAQASFVQKDGYARLVSDTDTYQYSDPWHYDSRGYVELGKRFAESLLMIPTRSFGSMFEPGASLNTVVGNGNGGEGPAWDAEWGVLTSGNDNIHRWSRDGIASVFREGAGTNGLLFDQRGNLFACQPKERRVIRIDRDGSLKVLTDQYEGHRYNTPNDLAFDSKGRLYFSDPRYGDRNAMELLDTQGQTIEGVYRLDEDGSVHRVIGREVDRANGVLVSIDDKYLLVADNNNNMPNGGRKLWRFDLSPDGSVELESARVLFDWGRGRGPDGLKQDAMGNLYVAAGLNRSNPPWEPDDSVRAGIYVLDIEGNWLDFVAVPTDEVTNCAFGGEDLRTLFITGGGTLYSIRTKHPGFLTKTP